MQVPLQITFRNMPPLPAIEARIRERAEALDRFYGGLIGCRVMLEPSARRHYRGKLYHLRVSLTVPGREIVIRRDPPERHAHEDILAAVRDAFDAARRRLEDHARSARGAVKLHATPAHGTVASLFPERGYGFIRSSDGEEIYMHRNAVADDGFAALRPGDEVRYSLHEGEGEAGPQASTVTRVGKHHLSPQA